MKRRKLTKAERALLWYDAEGKCQICGDDLGDNWHADHIIPFSISGKTNIHELQALCQKCNLRKGAAMLRQHQLNMLEICDQILEGYQIKEILCDITPGGGKSALPIILAHKLIPKRFDKICWVVPRSSLREQGERAFVEEYFRLPQVLGHNRLIRQSTNDRDPSRNLCGHITTYQAIAQNSWILTQEFERYNYILFLDEPHHVSVGSPFESALLPLIQKAGLVVYASGTLKRGDALPIAFLEYKQTEMGLVIDLTETPARRVIRYPRRLALEERAILPLEFEISDSKAEWVDRNGQTQSVDSFYDPDIDLGSALDTVLKTSFAHQLIDQCVRHWLGYKSHTYSRAKLLVVAPGIEIAKSYQEYLKNTLGIRSAIVHSKEDDKETGRKIKMFKKGNLDALVTVAIAYEGLDVPQITHVACLTHYRSEPWLEQCFARVNRTDGRKERGFIFAPDDPDLNRVMENLRLEQLSVAKLVNKEPGSDGGDLTTPTDQPGIGTVPLGSQLTDTRAIAPNLNEAVAAVQYRVIENARERAGLPNGLSITQLNRFLLEAGLFSLQNGRTEPNISVPLVTPTEQQENLLHSIETYTRKVDREYFNMTWGSANKEIVSVFKKPRRDMTVEELQSVWRFLQNNYPLDLTNDNKIY